MPDTNDKVSKIAALNKEMLESSGCCHLGQVCTNIVPGEGSPSAKVMFIGEGPGQKEDEQGKPFVGQAGQLLNQFLSEVGMSREEVFIANVLKCRPPNNRDPLPEEVEACWPWLKRQIEIIDPALVVLLGRFATERFLPGMKISVVRGKVLRRNIPGIGLKVFMPTYHPAAALYHRQWTEPLREDFRKIPRVLELLASSEVQNDSADLGTEWDSLEIGPKKQREQGKLL